ncbi:hypothetical protein PRIPAC_82915 [Pristionchus pacificus]|uniref:G protein-coupled receptor n=1 Tax=Pristionchus pacificus TaxID=54126 RepID=A0A2A6C427_PRIPA|nr:hypothetical protein PRIPAC_82915 [Pristionchus pacificus]|eukprot:PDM72803.1 G protein-coupled receptor [Pristionchus pacificus]
MLTLLEVVDFIVDAHLGGGILLNALLFYIVRRFSKSSVGTYKNLLATFAAYDIFLSTLHLLTRPAAVITGTTFGVVTETRFEDRKLTSIYCACFTVPFALMNIHFIYRFWSVRYPHLIALFSSKKFIAFISIWPLMEFIVWYHLCYYALTGDVDEIGTHILRDEFARRYGVVLNDGWIVMNYWENDEFQPRPFISMVTFDVIIFASFTMAITLGSLTFFIRTTDKLSAQAYHLQRTLFIAVCAQTFVPLVFVYIPYYCVINFAFFNINLGFVDIAWMRMTACFPAWDAVIIIAIIRDYREGFLGMFRKKKVVTGGGTTWKTVSSMLLPSGVSGVSQVSQVPSVAVDEKA